MIKQEEGGKGSRLAPASEPARLASRLSYRFPLEGVSNW